MNKYAEYKEAYKAMIKEAIKMPQSARDALFGSALGVGAGTTGAMGANAIANLLMGNDINDNAALAAQLGIIGGGIMGGVQGFKSPYISDTLGDIITALKIRPKDFIK